MVARPDQSQSSNPDSATENAIVATPSANLRNPCRTAQHDTGQPELDFRGLSRPDFYFRNRLPERNNPMGNCRYCGQNAGFLRRQHGQCRDLHATGVREMTQLAAQAAGSPSFSELALRQTLRAIAARAQATEDDISQAIAADWLQRFSNNVS